MLRYLVVLAIILTSKAYAQQTDFEFLVEKIKTDYPGFAEKTNSKQFSQLVQKAAKNLKSDTFKSMATIVDFFKDRHLDLVKNREPIDTATCTKNFSSINDYLINTKTLKAYEGYWITETKHCIIGIRQVSKNPLRLVGYVIKSAPGTAMYPGLIFCELERKTTYSFFTRALGVKSGSAYYLNSIFRNDSVMTMGPYYKWHKLKARDTASFPILQMPSDLATGKWLNASTFLFTIPASTAKNVDVIAAIFEKNQDIVTRCEHLIVDVRNNTGGTARAYDQVSSLLYTGPYVPVNGLHYATRDEAVYKEEMLKEYLKNGGNDTAYIKSLQYQIALNNDSAGRFVQFPVDTIRDRYVYEYPKRVSIIANFGCQSACEMFLLDAKNSKKVKLFGETTMGAIDYLNFYPQITPSGKYKLFIATSRRNIPPGESKLDGKGINPDVPISDTIPDWVDFVNHYYEKH